MSKSAKKAILFGCFAALSLIVIFSLRSAGIDLKDLLALRGRFLGYVERHAAVSAAAFILAYILVVALSIPGATVLTLLGGFLFGPALGVVLVNLGATTGAFLVFLAARYLLRDSLMEKYREPLSRLNRELEINGAGYLLTLRFIPLFPFFLINLLAGLTPVRSSTYLWTTAVGIVPGSLVYTLLGASGADLGAVGGFPPRLVAGLVLLGMVSLLPVIIKKIRGRKAPMGIT